MKRNRDIDDIFEELMKSVNKMFNVNWDELAKQADDHYEWGFSWRLGEDGIPKYEEWGQRPDEQEKLDVIVDRNQDIYTISVLLNFDNDLTKEETDISFNKNKITIKIEDDIEKQISVPFNIEEAETDIIFEEDEQHLIITSKVKDRRKKIEVK